MATVKSRSTILLWSVIGTAAMVIGSFCTSSVLAQRLNIPSAGMSSMAPAPTAMQPSVATPDPYAASAGTSIPSPYNATPYNTTPYNATPSPYGTYNGTTTSPYSVAPSSPYGASSSITSPYPGGEMVPSVPVTPGTVAGPMPTFQSQAVAPPPTWDPYAPPGTTVAPTLIPADYYPVVPTMDMTSVNEWRQRFMKEVWLDYTFLSARGSNRFGTNDLDLNVTFQFPFLYNDATPLNVTPGFAFHWWEGPISDNVTLTTPLNALPPRVYDAYLGAGWNPQPTPWFGGELYFRVGVYSDFRKVTSESVRYTGTGLAVITFSPVLKAKLGIVYYDRVKVKLLPAGGLVWTPNENVKFDILFPNPQLSRRMTTMGTTDLWLYLRGEYGGGSWVITPDLQTSLYQVDYNDLRAALGCEFDNVTGLDAMVEVGVAFERELVVRDPRDEFSPSTTIFLRVGATY